MALKDVPVDVGLAANNRSGGVYNNAGIGVTIIRWESLASLSLCVDLFDIALQELCVTLHDTLVFDMRNPTASRSNPVRMALMHAALSEKLVKHFIYIGDSAELTRHPDFPDLVAVAEENGVAFCMADNYAKATDWLNLQRSGIAPFNATELPPHFKSTYGGSIYSLPEHAATVIRLSGATQDYRILKRVFRDGFELHRQLQAKVCIIDSSLCPPITQEHEYTFLYREIVKPLTSGICEKILHVRRAGDRLSMRKGAPSAATFVTSMGVPCFEVSTLPEALALLDTLQGKSFSKLFPETGQV